MSSWLNISIQSAFQYNTPMRQSQLFTKTRREAPADEVSKNAILLTRAGFIYKEMAGVYSLLPMGLKVIKKLESALMILYKSCNVVISDGPFSGNRFEHLTINLIPRQQKDNVVINWKGNKAEENDLKKVQQDIIQAIPIEKKEIPFALL